MPPSRPGRPWGMYSGESAASLPGSFSSGARTRRQRRSDSTPALSPSVPELPLDTALTSCALNTDRHQHHQHAGNHAAYSNGFNMNPLEAPSDEEEEDSARYSEGGEEAEDGSCNGFADVPLSPPQAALFTDIYLRQARLDNIVQMMGYHPKYLDAFKSMKERLLFEDGPLSVAHRNYIAIMGASRHRCEYLACAHAREFTLAGGNEDWLLGLDRAPRKLQALDDVNKVMAHRPWLLTTEHFQALLQSGDGEERWSQSELMQAVVILAHTHALCSFVFGIGLAPDVDDPQGYTFDPVRGDAHRTPQNGSSENSASPGIEESPLPGSKPRATASDDIPKLIARMEELKRLPEPSEEEQARNFEAVREEQREHARSAPDSPSALRAMAPAVDLLLERFVRDPEYGYKDFHDKSEGASESLRVQDYSWDRDGIIICNDLYQDMGDFLDKRFKVSESLTYNTMGDQDQIDTTAFRQAVLLYADAMFGVRHDDYNYTKMHTLLERPLKAFTKAVVCFPERITVRDRNNFIPALKFSEKVHIQLMLLEARLRAELLYALRQLNEIRR